MIPTPQPHADSTRPARRGDEPRRFDAPRGDDGDAGGDATLEDAALREQDYLRGRLRDELGREPSDEELREWQREHTEGY
ncbi:MAG: hypothetical protein LC746_00765 [Acidobacteria bacterium]|nr:hypothetical protein [Acidobacteriota bacterium]